MSPRRAAALHDTDITLREHLITSAARVIGARGPAGVTVREIAKEAGVATGGLYNHFADKNELLALGLAAHVREIVAELPVTPVPGSGTVAENLAAYVERSVLLHQRIMPAFVGMMGQPDVLARFDDLPDARVLPRELTDYLRAEQRAGRIAPDADPVAVTTLLVGACHELVLPRLLRGEPTHAEVPRYFARDLVRTLLRGIAGDEDAVAS